MKNINSDSPLFSLTCGQYLELNRQIFEEFKAQLSVSPASTEKELLSIEEASEFLKLSVATLYSMNCKRKIPFTKISGKVYYKRSALLAWLETGDRKTIAQIKREVNEGEASYDK